jgi:asparaginyl-tRNA synthetase
MSTTIRDFERDIDRLKNVFQPFPRVTHNEAAKILRGEVEVNGKNALKVQEQDLVEAINDLEKVQTKSPKGRKIKTSSKGERRFHEGKILQLRKAEILTEKHAIFPNGLNRHATLAMTMTGNMTRQY